MKDPIYTLKEKFDRYKRKYYISQSIKGILLFLTLAISTFLIVDIIEYSSYLKPAVKSAIILSYLAISISLFIYWIIIPLLKVARIGKIISDKQVAKRLQTDFPDLKDKLINTLELSGKLKNVSQGVELIHASIEKRVDEVKDIDFSGSITYKRSYRWVRAVFIPVFIIAIILIISPQIITEPTNRLVKYNEEFERPLPYQLTIINEKLEVLQYEDITIRSKAIGDMLPGEVFVLEDGMRRRMYQDGDQFTYRFNNLYSPTSFRLITEDYISDLYTIEVLPKPLLSSYTIKIQPPAHVASGSETFENASDFLIHEGSKVVFSFYTLNTERMSLDIDDESFVVEPTDNSNLFEYEQVISEDAILIARVSNRYLDLGDSISIYARVTKDQYPEIEVVENIDSLMPEQLFFTGYARDDHGIRDIQFLHKTGENDWNEEAIEIIRGSKLEQFYFSKNIYELATDGEDLQICFKVIDNDRINGYKESFSNVFIYEMETESEIAERIDNSRDSLSNRISSTLNRSRRLKENIQDLKRDLIDKESFGWEEQQKVEELVNEQKALEKEIQELQKEREKLQQENNQYNNYSESILEKQKQLEKLFEELMDDEMQDLFEQLDQLSKEYNKDKMQELLDKMDMSNEDLEEQLDRNLELFKQLEFEKKLEESLGKINELAEKQLNEANRTKAKEGSKEEQAERQEEISKEFEEVRSDMDALQRMNEELEQQHDMPDMEQLMEQIEESMQDAQMNLQKGRMNKASGNQQSAGQQMQEMAESMFGVLNQMQQQQVSEDIESVREILENLVYVSVSQEEIILDARTISIADPAFIELMQRQQSVIEDLAMVEDSLRALAKRQVMIESFVNEKIKEINRNVEKSQDDLEERRVAQAQASQQFVMKDVNELAVMLSEAIEKMQEQMQMQSEMSGSSSCKNPGAGKPSISTMQQLQQQLNGQINAMKQGMKEGGKDGSKQTFGNSKEIARMAAQQEAIRRMLEQYQNDLKSEGLQDKGIGESLKKMEETERDLVNRRINQQMLDRQQEIMIRLLHSERAELEREKKQERESSEAKTYNLSNPETQIEYKESTEQFGNIINRRNLKYQEFYNNKIKEYLLKIRE